MDEVGERLLEGIDLIVRKYVDNANYDKCFIGIVKEINDDGTYNVEVNRNTIYTNIKTNGGTCKVNDIVRLISPQNNFNNVFILKETDKSEIVDIQNKLSLLEKEISTLTDIVNKNTESINEIKEFLEQKEIGLNEYGNSDSINS